MLVVGSLLRVVSWPGSANNASNTKRTEASV